MKRVKLLLTLSIFASPLAAQAVRLPANGLRCQVASGLKEFHQVIRSCTALEMYREHAFQYDERKEVVTLPVRVHPGGKSLDALFGTMCGPAGWDKEASYLVCVPFGSGYRVLYIPTSPGRGNALLQSVPDNEPLAAFHCTEY